MESLKFVLNFPERFTRSHVFFRQARRQGAGGSRSHPHERILVTRTFRERQSGAARQFVETIDDCNLAIGLYTVSWFRR